MTDPSLRVEPLLNKPSSQEGLNNSSSTLVEGVFGYVVPYCGSHFFFTPDKKDTADIYGRMGCDVIPVYAATLISELQAERDRISNELDAANNNHRSMAEQMAALGERATAAESALSRHPSFNDAVEAAAKIVDEPLNGIEINRFIADGKVMTDRYGRELFITKENVEHILAAISSAIRSLKLPDYRGGEAKTAESDHSPSTREG